MKKSKKYFVGFHKPTASFLTCTYGVSKEIDEAHFFYEKDNLKYLIEDSFPNTFKEYDIKELEIIFIVAD